MEISEATLFQNIFFTQLKSPCKYDDVLTAVTTKIAVFCVVTS